MHKQHLKYNYKLIRLDIRPVPYWWVVKLVYYQSFIILNFPVDILGKKAPDSILCTFFRILCLTAIVGVFS